MDSIILAGLTLVASTGEAAGEAAAEGGGGGASALIPKMAEFIPAVISFLIVFLVLAKFAWPAISGMLDRRADTIKTSLETAEQAKLEAERLLREYKEQLADARKEAAAVLAQAKAAAETTREELVQKAQAEAEDIVAKAREAIEAEKLAAIAELQGSVADLTVAVAGKLIGSELTTEDHLKVIEKYVAESGSLNAN